MGNLSLRTNIRERGFARKPGLEQLKFPSSSTSTHPCQREAHFKMNWAVQYTKITEELKKDAVKRRFATLEEFDKRWKEAFSKTRMELPKGQGIEALPCKY